MPPRSLAAFLTAARAVLATPAAQRPTPLTIVVGNESADLDSLCSAVLAAYFWSHTPSHSASALHIPLCNLPREDLQLRPELAAAFASSQSAPSEKVPLDSLITLSDLPDDLAAAQSRWLLVDHNALTGDLARRFAGSVVGCIDHHVDEGAVYMSEDNKYPRIIEPAGSCASLVLREHTTTWQRLMTTQPDAATDRLLARVALAPILVDTFGLQDARKTTDVDRQSAALAEAVLGGAMVGEASHGSVKMTSFTQNTAYNRTAYFHQLTRCKDDISGFSCRDVLRKDYKQWQERASEDAPLALGMSTVVRGFDDLLGMDSIGSEAALIDGLREFATDRRLDIAAVMTVQTDAASGKFGRQLLLWAFNERAARAVRLFVDGHAERLQLTPWAGGKLDDAKAERACWTQGSVEYSRKQLAPFLREAMRAA